MQYRIASPADYGQLAHLYWTYASEENDSPEFDENAFTRRFHAFLKACMGVDYICWVAEEAGESFQLFISVCWKKCHPFQKSVCASVMSQTSLPCLLCAIGKSPPD